MAINLEKKRQRNSCLIPLLIVLVVIAALIAGIGLIWGASGYMWTLRVIGILFALVALGALSSQSGAGCLALIVSAALAALCFWGANTIEKNYVKLESSVVATSATSSEMPQTSTYDSYGDDESEETDTVEDDSPYIDNRKIVRNAYIQGGDSYQFSIPNGTYQVFFYGGKGWNPDKKMAGGYTGGFVTNETFSKDNAVTLDYQGLNYELILQPNGNFNTEQSNREEMF